MNRKSFRVIVRYFLPIASVALLVLFMLSSEVYAQPEVGSVAETSIERRTYQRGNLVLPKKLQELNLGDLEYEQVPWREIVEDIFRRAKLKIVFDTEERKTFSRYTVGMSRTTFPQILHNLFGSPLSPDLYRDDKGVFHVIASMQGSSITGRPDLDTQTFWVVKNKVSVRTLLEGLFQEAKVPYEIDPAVTGTHSVNVQGALLRPTLKTMLSNISGGPDLTYQVKNGKFIVYPKNRDE